MIHEISPLTTTDMIYDIGTLTSIYMICEPGPLIPTDMIYDPGPLTSRDLICDPGPLTSTDIICDPGSLTSTNTICDPGPLTSTDMIRDSEPLTSMTYDTIVTPPDIDVDMSSHPILLISASSIINEATIQSTDTSKHQIHKINIFTLASCCVVNRINCRHSYIRRFLNEG